MKISLEAERNPRLFFCLLHNKQKKIISVNYKKMATQLAMLNVLTLTFSGVFIYERVTLITTQRNMFQGSEEHNFE